MALHPQNAEFVQRALHQLGTRPQLCVEIGSRLLHPLDPHDARPLVRAERFIGLDVQAGPGVDVVTLGHLYTPPGPVDLVLSLVALEHDPYWRETVTTAYGWLRLGGVLCIVCAGPGYPEHEHDASPEPGYYRNVSSAELLDVLQPLDAQVEVTDCPCPLGGATVPTRTRVMALRLG